MVDMMNDAEYGAWLERRDREANARYEQAWREAERARIPSGEEQR